MVLSVILIGPLDCRLATGSFYTSMKTWFCYTLGLMPFSKSKLARSCITRFVSSCCFSCSLCIVQVSWSLPFRSVIHIHMYLSLGKVQGLPYLWLGLLFILAHQEWRLSPGKTHIASSSEWCCPWGCDGRYLDQLPTALRLSLPSVEGEEDTNIIP